MSHLIIFCFVLLFLQQIPEAMSSMQREHGLFIQRVKKQVG